MPRPTPFDLVFAQIAETVFPTIRAALERGGSDAADRDAFLLVPEVVSLLHDLRPEEGLGEGMDQLVALVHHAYLLWDAGALTLPLAAGSPRRHARRRRLRPRRASASRRGRTTPSCSTGRCGPG